MRRTAKKNIDKGWPAFCGRHFRKSQFEALIIGQRADVVIVAFGKPTSSAGSSTSKTWGYHYHDTCWYVFDETTRIKATMIFLKIELKSEGLCVVGVSYLE